MDLPLIQPNQTSGALTSRAISAIDGYLTDHKPDLVIVQWDTTISTYRTRIYEKYSSMFQDKEPVFDVVTARRWTL